MGIDTENTSVSDFVENLDYFIDFEPDMCAFSDNYVNLYKLDGLI